ncbi:hypothetical protein Tco_0650323 [Tanacetum coccineum]
MQVLFYYPSSTVEYSECFAIGRVSTKEPLFSLFITKLSLKLCVAFPSDNSYFTSFDSAVHRVHAVSFDAAVLDVASTVSAACIVAAGYIVSAGICDAAVVSAGSSSSVSADYVPAGHVLISADRYRIC